MSKYKRSGRPQSSRCKRTTRPRLEALESRLVLSSTVLPTVPSPAPFAGAGNESAIVEGLYHNILGRVADSAGLASWAAQLKPKPGESAAQVAGQFFQSTEYTTDVVESYYTTYLGRVGDTGGGRILGGHAPGGRERGGGRGSVPLLARVQRQVRH